MRLDKNLFSDDQSLAVGAGTTPSTNSVNFGSAIGNVGDGESVRVYAQLTEDMAGGTNVQAILQDSDDDSTYATVLSGPVVPVAEALAGKVLLDVDVPKGMQQYHRVAYVTTGTHTAGKVTAGYKWDA